MSFGFVLALAGASNAARSADWLYQLQNAVPSAVVKRAAGIAVIDYSKNGGDGGKYSAAEIGRVVNAGTTPISYLSIGEAESYRFYWKSNWVNDDTNNYTGNEPSWLGHTNPNWQGNYKVRYWDKDWRKNYLAPYLDRVIGQGFKGVYLDIVDAFEYWSDRDNYTGNGGDETRRAGDPYDDEGKAASDMIELIGWIKEYAAANGGGADFKIIPQNGERLLAFDDGTLLALIDGIGVEDVWYDETNLTGTHNARLAFLRKIIAAGKEVYSVDYVDDGGHKDQANLDRIGDYAARCVAEGFSCYAGRSDRALDIVNPVIIHSGEVIGNTVRQLGTKSNVDVMVGKSSRADLFKFRGTSTARDDVVQDFRSKNDMVDLSLTLAGVANGARVAAVRVDDEGGGTYRIYVNSKRAGGETTIWLFDSTLSSLDVDGLVAAGVLKLVATPLADAANTPTTRSLASRLDKMREFAPENMLDVYVSIDDLDEEGKRNALTQIAGSNSVALTRIVRDNMSAFFGMANLRMTANQAVAGLVTGNAPVGRSMAALEQFYGGSVVEGLNISAASAKVEAGPLLYSYDGRKPGNVPVSIWVRSYYLGGRHRLDGGNSYGFSSAGVAGGADIAAGKNVLLGIVAGYGAPQVDYAGMEDVTKADSFQVGAYMSWSPGAWHINAIGGYQYTNYDMMRQIRFGMIDTIAYGRTSGSGLMFYGEVGRDFEAGGFTLSPEVSIEAARFVRAGYGETGAGVLNLTVAGQTETSLKMTVGGKVSKRFAMPGGSFLVPELRARWMHVFQGGDAVTTTSLNGANVSGQTFGIYNEKAPANRALLGLGLRFENSSAIDFALDVNSIIARGYISNAASFTGTFKF